MPRLIPDNPTVCLRVNETTRRKKGGNEGRKERRQKRQKERNTRKKVTALLATI